MLMDNTVTPEATADTVAATGSTSCSSPDAVHASVAALTLDDSVARAKSPVASVSSHSTSNRRVIAANRHTVLLGSHTVAHRPHMHHSQFSQLRTASHSSLMGATQHYRLQHAAGVDHSTTTRREAQRPSSYQRDPSLLSSTPIITRGKSPVPFDSCQSSSAVSRSITITSATLTSPNAAAATTNSSRLPQGAIRHRFSLPSINVRDSLYQQMEDNRNLRESVRAAKPQNPATTFKNLSKLLEIEIAVIGKPLINGYRVYIREDQAQDTDHNPVRILLFNDLVVCGPSIPSGPDNRRIYAAQTLCFFERAFAIQKVGLQGAHLMAGKASVSLLFQTEVARDDWVNTVYAAMDAHRAVLIRRARRMQQHMQRNGNTAASAIAKGNHGSMLAEHNLNPIWTAGLESGGNGFEHDYYGFDFTHSAKTYNPSISTGRSSRSTLATTWIPDQEATICMICQTTKFNVFVRKHHCRQCGRVICHKCSEFRTVGKKESQVRVCLECHGQSLSSDFFEPTESLYGSP